MCFYYLSRWHDTGHKALMPGVTLVSILACGLVCVEPLAFANQQCIIIKMIKVIEAPVATPRALLGVGGPTVGSSSGSGSGSGEPGP